MDRLPVGRTDLAKAQEEIREKIHPQMANPLVLDTIAQLVTQAVEQARDDGLLQLETMPDVMVERPGNYVGRDHLHTVAGSRRIHIPLRSRRDRRQVNHRSNEIWIYSRERCRQTACASGDIQQPPISRKIESRGQVSAAGLGEVKERLIMGVQLLFGSVQVVHLGLSRTCTY